MWSLSIENTEPSRANLKLRSATVSFLHLRAWDFFFGPVGLVLLHIRHGMLIALACNRIDRRRDPGLSRLPPALKLRLDEACKSGRIGPHHDDHNAGEDD